MANKAVNLSPWLNKLVPRVTFRRVATTSSTRAISLSLKPSGMQSSRKLQLEQATLMLLEFMASFSQLC
jgi:hypothetical protein